MASVSKFATPGALLTDLGVAAQDRFQEAALLLANGSFASAIAMGVYSLEINLKVLICKRLNLSRLPKAFEIHDLEGLLVLTGLRTALSSSPKAVQSNWQDVVDVSLTVNELRYSPSNWNQTDAQAFLGKLRDLPDGVLPWLAAQP